VEISEEPILSCSKGVVESRLQCRTMHLRVNGQSTTLQSRKWNQSSATVSVFSAAGFLGQLGSLGK
jgi:hypothetical protein